jgi:hypothetical protein
MKFAVKAVLGLSLGLSSLLSHPAFAAAPDAAHIKAVQDLLQSMQIQKVLPGVAARSRYSSDAQRQAVFAKLDKTPPADIYQRMAPPLAQVISTDTALEMTRFYNTPYGKKVIYKKYNGGPQIMMPGMKMSVPPEEKKERQRPAFVAASKELDAAEPAIDREAFKVLQAINK